MIDEQPYFFNKEYTELLIMTNLYSKSLCASILHLWN